MDIRRFYTRGVWKYRRIVSKYLYRKIIKLQTTRPIISFSFDDAPRTAFTNGGEILNKYGVAATFYVSLGLLGSDSPSGPIASIDNLHSASRDGHEMGCHTFRHEHSWDTKTKVFVQSVLKNRKALSEILPEACFLSLAYPICGPKPETKREMGCLFSCCRGGEETFNVGNIDLNLLNAFFLDVRNSNTVDEVKKLIDKNTEVRGWLIFATHDIDDNPSRYGCTKEFFEKTVKYCVQSGALLMPVGKACLFAKKDASHSTALP